MENDNTSYLEIKKSKFYGYIFNISSVSEILKIIDEIKLNHKKYSQLCYGYYIDDFVKGFYDDREPKKSAGYQILNVIEKRNIKNILIVIVRYHGGKNLGIGNLSRSYKNVANDLL